MQAQPEMEIESSLALTRHKSDIVYYKAFTQLAHSSVFAVLLNVAKSATFIVLIPVNLICYNIEYGDLLLTSFILNAGASLLGVALYVCMRLYVYGSVPVYLNFAQITKHSTQEPLQTQAVQEIIRQCVSQTIYVAQTNLKEEDMNDTLKKMHLSATKGAINSLIRNKFTWMKTLQNLYILFSLSSLIYSIVTLAQEDMPVVDQALLIVYVIISALTNLPIIVIFILLALSPLICIGLLFFCCCCAPKGQGQFIDLEPKAAESNDVVNAGGDCSICFMNIAEGQKVYVLPCSDKHVFHTECLRHWSKVKNNCPNCRQELPMTDVDRYSKQ